ncbi:MAG TPA: hypothetical protein VGN75_17640 [Kaistia sp.]|jgi:hypothetical protein|nr:hypothetical protein [Kaistia sp.]
MTVVVITPPAALLTPADIPGPHAADDATVAALIQAATEQIDGPDGWLRRAIGPQVLEMRGYFGREYLQLPYPPLIEIIEVAYADADGVEHLLDPAEYQKRDCGLSFKLGAGWVRSHVCGRIRYRAGFDGRSPADGGTGPVPERVRQAVVLAVRQLQAAGVENLFLRSEEIEGVGSTQYVVSEAAGAVITRAIDSLLSGLRIPRV